MIEDWVQSRLGDINYSGQELRANCPFCYSRNGRGDTKKHLYISKVKPVAYCHRCNWKGHHVGLLMSVEGCTYAEALNYMEEPPTDIRGFDSVHSPRGLVQGHVMASQPDGFIGIVSTLTSRYMDAEHVATIKYLRKRKVPKRLLERFGYVPGTHRLWILVDTNWWQGRLIIPGEPKYISPPWPIGDSIWNDEALFKYTEVTICEGVFSAIAVGPHAIALCAKNITDQQAERLTSAKRSGTYNILFDAGADKAAHDAANKLRYFGFNGNINIHYMRTGDPAYGLYGGSYSWGWEAEVRAKFI